MNKGVETFVDDDSKLWTEDAH